VLPFLNVKNVHIHFHMPALPVAPDPVDLGEIKLKATNDQPAERFELSEDGTYVTDHQFGLLWPVDESEKEMTFADAETYASKTVIAGKLCRLPEEHELASLRDLTRHNPAIHPIFKCRAGWTWTKTPTAWSSGLVFCVSFYHGFVSHLARNYRAFVRPVRSVSPGQ
jgi:hypothetical protein